MIIMIIVTVVITIIIIIEIYWDNHGILVDLSNFSQEKQRS